MNTNIQTYKKRILELKRYYEKICTDEGNSNDADNFYNVITCDELLEILEDLKSLRKDIAEQMWEGDEPMRFENYGTSPDTLPLDVDENGCLEFMLTDGYINRHNNEHFTHIYEEYKDIFLEKFDEVDLCYENHDEEIVCVDLD